MDTIKKRNNSIDIFRYICAVLVVVIHTEPFYTGEISFIGIFLKQFLARIAVPFFFVVSGYFFFLKAFDGKASLKSVWKLIKVYAFWSIPYFLIDIWVLHDEGVVVWELAKKIILEFFIFGSYYHFWFFPALIYATLFAYVIYRFLGSRPLVIISILLYVFGCMGTTYAQLFESVPLLSNIFAYEYFPNICRIFMIGLPFFVLGGLIVKIREHFSTNMSKSTEVFMIVAVLAVFFIEKILLLLCDLPIEHPSTLALYSLVGTVVIVLLNHPFYGHEKLAHNARLCANFIYYMHPAFLLLADRAFVAVLGNPLNGALMFVLTVIVLTIVGLIISRVGFVRKLLS